MAYNFDTFAPRNVFGNKLNELGEVNSDLVVMAADLAYTCSVVDFSHAYPERFLNVGIAEQNMVGMSAGLAMEGKQPWITSIAPFTTLRCCEQLRTDVCYNDLHVVVAGIMSGISGAPLGSTHYCIEDMGMFRVIPNMTVLSPADQWEIEQAMEAAVSLPGPVYLRLGSGNEPQLPVDRNGFEVGKAYTLRHGEEVALIATGYMVHKALQAAEILEQKGISAGVYDHPSIKPLDRDSILAAAENAKLTVTLEEHNVYGGLGSAVAEVIAQNGCQTKLHPMGIPDLYPGIGSREELLTKYSLDVDSIVINVEKALR